VEGIEMKYQEKVFNVCPKRPSLECHTGGNRYPDAEIRAYYLDSGSESGMTAKIYGVLGQALIMVIAVIVTGIYAANDTASVLLQKGIESWDSTLLKSALARSCAENPASDYLFKATCLWRLQIIAYLNGDKKGTIHHGKSALDILDTAARKSEDAYLTYARRAYVSQLLAGTSLKNGPIYGARTGKYLDELKKIKPKGFDTRFIDAVNLLEMPSFVGGDPKKAQERLVELHREFPDSSAVAISLARAMIKNKEKEEAQKVLDQVLKKDSKNLWAKKVKNEIK
jgi:tetratricopeptide (TPR) repeat protein